MQAQNLERRARLARRDQIACDLQRMRVSRRIVAIKGIGVESEI